MDKLHYFKYIEKTNISSLLIIPVAQPEQHGASSTKVLGLNLRECIWNTEHAT